MNILHTDWMAPVGFQWEGTESESELPPALNAHDNTASIQQSNTVLPGGRAVAGLKLGLYGQTYTFTEIRIQSLHMSRALVPYVNNDFYIEAHFVSHWLHLLDLMESIFKEELVHIVTFKIDYIFPWQELCNTDKGLGYPACKAALLE